MRVRPRMRGRGHMSSWLKSWVPFLFGTPQRTIATAIVLSVIALIAVPGLMAAVSALAWSLLLQLLQLAIVVAVIVFLWKKFIVGGSGRGKK